MTPYNAKDSKPLYDINIVYTFRHQLQQSSFQKMALFKEISDSDILISILYGCSLMKERPTYGYLGKLGNL